MYAGHFDTVRSIEWSADSRFFLSASKDLTARIWSLDSEEDHVKMTLGGHKEAIVGAWFSQDQETIYTVSKDGALLVWRYSASKEDVDEANEEDLQWRIEDRHYFNMNFAKVTCAAFHPESVGPHF